MKNKQQYISVLLPLPLNQAYDYLPAKGVQFSLGDMVRVPFGKKFLEGVIIEIHDRTPEVAQTRLKTVLETLNVPAFPPEALTFIRLMSHYTLSTLGSVLKLFMSVARVFDPPKTQTYYSLPSNAFDNHSGKLTPLQKRICAVFHPQEKLSKDELQERVRFSPAVLKLMVEKGILEREEIAISTKNRPQAYHYKAPQLSASQQAVSEALKEHISSDSYSVSVIDGVTGSGKTEVYFEAIAHVLKGKGQVVVLLPEIVLSPQWLHRFEERFGEKPVMWHSDVPERLRREAWLDIAHGRARVVVGARSALFLPFQELKLIIVDEEHDASYKQEEGVIYNGRDMAVLRAHVSRIPVILASATPSLETIENCRRGRYHYYELKKRHGTAQMPNVQLISLNTVAQKEKRKYWISETLAELILKTTARKEQVLLYLNRRGYAPVTLCRSCGEKIACPRCSVFLVEHKIHGDLRCHHCGYSQSFHAQCLSCGAEESFVSCGPGVERIAEEVRVRFPALKSLVIASDHVHSKGALDGLFDQIHRQQVDVIIGTQIMAKGHHFPHLTLVGVIDADLGLSGADVRASERIFQTLHQVAGRAGRAHKQGHVYIQTHFPEHAVMKALCSAEKDSFIEQELLLREQAMLPPYGRMVAFVFKGLKETAVELASKRFARCFPPSDQYRFLGPIPAPIYRIRGHYRWRALLQSSRQVSLQKIVQKVLKDFRLDPSVRLTIDVDPYSFL